MLYRLRRTNAFSDGCWLACWTKSVRSRDLVSVSRATARLRVLMQPRHTSARKRPDDHRASLCVRCPFFRLTPSDAAAIIRKLRWCAALNNLRRKRVNSGGMHRAAIAVTAAISVVITPPRSDPSCAHPPLFRDRPLPGSRSTTPRGNTSRLARNTRDKKHSVDDYLLHVGLGSGLGILLTS